VKLVKLKMLRRLLLSNVPRANLLFNQSFSRRLCIAPSSHHVESQDFDLIDDSTIKDPCRDTQEVLKNARVLRLKLMHCFAVDEKQAFKLIEKNKALVKIPLKHISKNIELLYEKKITAKNIMDNPWLLAVPPSKHSSSYLYTVFIT
jgi:hypothetical protein